MEPEKDRMDYLVVFGGNTPYAEIHDREHKGLDPHAHYIGDDKKYSEAHPLTKDEQYAYNSFKDDEIDDEDDEGEDSKQ